MFRPRRGHPQVHKQFKNTHCGKM
jgi:hypothetical protein